MTTQMLFEILPIIWGLLICLISLATIRNTKAEGNYLNDKIGDKDVAEFLRDTVQKKSVFKNLQVHRVVQQLGVTILLLKVERSIMVLFSVIMLVMLFMGQTGRIFNGLGYLYLLNVALVWNNSFVSFSLTKKLIEGA